MKKMMSFKGLIYAEADRERNMLQFYWSYRGRRTWLFAQRYTSNVHRKFQQGLRDYDIRNYKWGANYRMDKTMYKIPSYMAYINKYAA